LGLVKGLLPGEDGLSYFTAFADLLVETETGFVRLGMGDEPGVGLVFLFRSRRVLSLAGTRTAADVRGFERPNTSKAAFSRGVKMASVFSSQGSTDPCAGREGRAPRRFFVAFSN